MKHTQGEWIANDGQIYPQETGKTLALIPYYDTEDEEQQANARLMAAAPELILAIKNLMDAEGGEAGDNEAQQLAWRNAEQAIYKATNP